MAQEQLFQEFQLLTNKDWQLKAEEGLRGQPITSLQSNWFGLDIEPYYSSEDILDSARQLPLRATTTGWINYVSITVENEIQANKLARDSLMIGATGLYFNLIEPANFNILLEKIDLSACAIAFEGQVNVEEYLLYAEQNTSADKLSGFVGRPEIYTVTTSKEFYPTVIAPSSENELSVLTTILFELHKILRPIAEDHATPIIQNIAYKLEMSLNYFFSIAKIRALRILLKRFFSAYSLDFNEADFHIISLSKYWNKSDYAPHENMLKATTSAMAATIGGCNSLIIESGDSDDQEKLVARNISSILEFESFLNKVADPAAGSYFIENLTDNIVNKVWQNFMDGLDS